MHVSDEMPGRQVARLEAELRGADNQLAATAEILRLISTSPTDVQPVFDTIVRSAVSLCGGLFANLFRFDGELLHFVATCNVDPGYEALLKAKYPMVPDESQVSGRVILTRSVVHLEDAVADASYDQRFPHAMAWRRMLGVPMLRNGQPLGVLVVGWADAGPVPAMQEQLLKGFADQACIVVENVRLFDEVQTRNRELSEALEQQIATSGILRAIAGSPSDLDPVLKTVAETAAQLCDAYDATILLLRGKTLAVTAHYGPIPIDFPELPIRRGVVSGRAFLDRAPVHVHDLQAAAGEFPDGNAYAVRLGFRTILSQPLLRGDEAIGVLMLRRPEVRPFSDKQMELLKTFADQAVIAIENVRLFEEVQARTRELSEALEQQTATADVLKVISRSTFDLRVVLDTLVESAIRLCCADKGGIVRSVDGVLRYVSTYGYAPEFRAYLDANPPAPGRGSAVGRVIEERAVVQIHDIQQDSEYRMSATADVGGFRTVLAVPLFRESDLIGVFAMTRVDVQRFNEKEIELVKTFADQAVIAIENTRLLNELRESLQQQTATADVLKAISRSTFDLKTVLQTLVKSAVELCDAEKGTITRQIDGKFYRAETHGFSPKFMDLVRDMPVLPERGSVTGRALLEGRIIHIPDVECDPDYTFSEAQRLGGFRTILGVPMLREGDPLGVLALTRAEVRPFTERQIELVSTFADQAAIAIENARLFAEVQARTAELSNSLDELRTAQDRLIQTEKLASLGQLTAGVAHEIKNPLNFVNNFSALSAELVDEMREILRATNLDPKTRFEIDELSAVLKGNLEKVVAHGKRADSIVKNMLLHSRQGSGEHRPADINAIVEESLNLAYHGARAEKPAFNITLEKSLDPSAGEVDVFPQEITRVLLNLIANGFYATTKKKEKADGAYEPTLTAITRNLGDQVEIRIRDNGTGIPPEVKEKLFSPFFTTKPAGEGTGLGLSLSHDIVVNQHAGTIEIDTEPDRFTEFRIVLPRGAASLGETGGHA